MLAAFTIVVSFVGLVYCGAAVPNREDAVHDVFQAGQIETALAIMFFCFGGSVVIPNFLHDMEDPKHGTKALGLALFGVFWVYAGFGAVGYWFWGEEVSESFVINLGFDLDGEEISSSSVKVVRWITVAMLTLNKQLILPLQFPVTADFALARWPALYALVGGENPTTSSQGEGVDGIVIEMGSAAGVDAEQDPAFGEKEIKTNLVQNGDPSGLCARVHNHLTPRRRVGIALCVLVTVIAAVAAHSLESLLTVYVHFLHFFTLRRALNVICIFSLLFLVQIWLYLRKWEQRHFATCYTPVFKGSAQILAGR
jgi:hypothetical protein